MQARTFLFSKLIPPAELFFISIQARCYVGKHKGDTFSFGLLYPEMQPITHYVSDIVDPKFCVVDLAHGAVVDEVRATLTVETLSRGMAPPQCLRAAAAAGAVAGPPAASPLTASRSGWCRALP